MTPSAATRLAALLALAPLLMRSSSSAFLRSPPVSDSAFLHSIMGRPVSSRSSLTLPALISVIPQLLQIEKKGRSAPFRPHGERLFAALAFLHLDELVARCSDDLFEGLRAPFEHRVGDAARVEPDRAARVVVARNHVADALGVVVRIDHADYRDAELVGFGHRAFLVADVDDEQGIRQAGELLDAAERALQFRQLALQAERLFLRDALEAAVQRHLFHLLEALDRLLHGLEVGEHAAEPAMVDVRHGAALRLLPQDVARLPLGAHEKKCSSIGSQLARELERFLIHRQGALEIDDVDLVAVAEDVRRHLRIPVPGLMSEMDAGLQHLTHRYRHDIAPRVKVCRLRQEPESTTFGHPNRPGGNFDLQSRKSAQNSSIIRHQWLL